MSCYSPWLNFGLWPIPVSSLGYSWVASNFRTLVMRKQHTVHLHSFLHLSCFPIKGFIVFVLVLQCAHMVRVQLWVKRHFDAFPPNQQCLCPTVGTSETLPSDHAATLRNNGKWEGTVSLQMGYPPLWKFGVSTQTHTHTHTIAEYHANSYKSWSWRSSEIMLLQLYVLNWVFPQQTKTSPNAKEFSTVEKRSCVAKDNLW